MARRATALPIGNRTLAVVSAAGGDDLACPGASAGLRVVALSPQLPADVATIRYPNTAPPGLLVASGEQAFVAWHADGLRVIDLGLVAPRTVAQFVPIDPDVTGVALLASYVVVVDRASGLYVLDRPEEGHPESFWTKVKNAQGPISIGGVLLIAVAFATRWRRGLRRAADHALEASPVFPAPVPPDAGK